MTNRQRNKRREIRAAATPSTLNLAAPVEIQAAAGEGKRPTFTINGYTGAVMRVAGFYTPVVVDLGGLKASRDRIPILLDHDSSRIIGQTDAIEIDASGVKLTGTITGDDGDAAKVVTHAKNGFEWQASIGASIVRGESLKAGEKATVNGREVTGPLLIARESRLNETSFVAIGADSQTSAAVAATQPAASTATKGRKMNEFEKWLQAKGFDPETLSDEQSTTLKAAWEAETAKPQVKTDTASGSRTLDQIMEGRRRENDRQSAINALAEQFAASHPMLMDEIHAIARDGIEHSRTPQDVKLAMYEVATSVPVARDAGSTGFSPKLNGEVLEAAICQSLKLDVEGEYSDRTMEAAYKAYGGEISLKELLMVAAEAHGQRFRSSRDVTALIKAAGGEGQTIRGQGWSTFSLPGILSNVANKMLVRYFNSVDTSWRQVARIGSVRDFKTTNRYSLTGDTEVKLLPPNGEIKHGVIGEIAYTNKADTYARMLAISRQDIINDDISAFSDVGMKLTRGAAKGLNKVFWTKFLDNATFFSASNDNVSTGAGSALDATGAGIEAAEAVYADLTDPDGDPLGSMPQILLVPPALRNVALRLMNSDLMTGGATDAGSANVFKGRYKVVSSPYLSAASITGSSDAAWYLLADPMDLPVIEVVFLNGREAPTVQQSDTEFNTLGIQFRVFHDFGVSLQEYRGGVRSAGS